MDILALISICLIECVVSVLISMFAVNGMTRACIWFEWSITLVYVYLLLFQIDWLTRMLLYWRAGKQAGASVATHHVCVRMCIPFALLLLCAPHAIYSAAAYHPYFCFYYLPTTSDLLRCSFIQFFHELVLTV